MAGTGEEQDSAVANTCAHTGSCVPGRILMSKFFPGNSQSTALPSFFSFEKSTYLSGTAARTRSTISTMCKLKP